MVIPTVQAAATRAVAVIVPRAPVGFEEFRSQEGVLSWLLNSDS
jgi:hypothetical protein